MADILSVIGIVYAPHRLAVAGCKAYLFMVLWTSFFSFNYVCYDISGKKRMKMLRWMFVGLTFVWSIAVLFMPINLHNEEAVYSDGMAVNFAFILAPIYILGALALTFVFSKKMNPYRRNSVRIWMSLEAAAALIQVNRRELLLIGFMMALGVTVLFARLENPEAGIDSRTGAFRTHILRDYLDQLYDSGEQQAFIIISGSEDIKDDPDVEDRLLRDVAQYLISLSDGKVFRGGGKDFIVAFPSAEKAEATAPEIARRFRSNWLEDLYIAPNFMIVPDISVFANSGEFLSLYRYYANLSVSADDEFRVLDVKALEELRNFRLMQREIRDALAEDRVEVFLQPIYSVREGAFVSAEALVRLRDRNGGLIMPGKFIPVAERSGLIEPIGDRVFEIVCALIRNHDVKRFGLRYIEVNLSVVQCENKSLAERYSGIIDHYGISPQSINLEITESGSIKQNRVLIDNMENLRNFGCSFSLDDFGTGESNLNYIVNMPVDIIKIDRTMTIAYFDNDRARVMLESVTGMIKQMGMKIVAEGVEEKYQLEALSELGVDYIQGYYFSKPIPVPEFLTFMRNSIESA